MLDTVPDEDLLLALLNSAPMVGGVPSDDLGTPGRARAWLAGVGGLGSGEERRHVLAVRSALQAVVRGEQQPAVLAPFLRDVALVPDITGDRVAWTLNAAPERLLAVRAVLAWGVLTEQSPGRLRRCANDDCRLFLIDRSKNNTARWCSMARCGNRMKARRHYQRARPPVSPR